MISSFKELKQAASGKMPRTTTSPTAEEIPQPEAPSASAYPGYMAPGQSRSLANLMAANTSGVPGSTIVAPTPMYQQYTSGTPFASGTKYAGFPTEGALKSAIQGGAINMATMLPQNLRSAANVRFSELEKLSGPGRKAIEKDLFGGTQDSYKQYQEYGRELGDWYAQNAAPAVEYARTAQQLEQTPISRLAQNIATTRYGQNYDWATDQFRNLDTEYAAMQRNQRYMEQTGMPYDEYVAQLQERDRINKYQSSIANEALQAATGLRGNYITSVTARTPQQLQTALQSTVKYQDPKTQYEEGMASEGTGEEVIKMGKQYINDRDYQSAFDLATSLEDEGFPDAAYIIYSMLKVSGASEDIKNKLALSGIVTP